ncbi:putative phosphatidate phosphatase [Oppia nitens]|uniref:putative phosphatidate phosphatase n=1 Tax=Oppia nitens TaxID=1686743 RepID=UPI0023DB520E|nr:putative phosphatidate phosphatase [Oppia nitens]
MNSFNTYLSANKRCVRKVGTDLCAIIILGIPVFVLFLVGQPYKRGFNCDDESIRYPYKDNTITSVVNYLYSTLIPIITIIIVEIVYHRKAIQNYNQSQDPDDSTGLNKMPANTDLLWQIYCRLAPFIFGALISQLTTDIAKYTIGRLRPHFIDVCKPEISDGTRFTIQTGCQGYEYRYITDYQCTSIEFNDHRKRDAHLSFMSGHSSFVAYCLVYLVIYLQVRLRWSALGFIRPLYQTLLIYLVIYTGFTRISDYKHHWSDVLIGLLQGLVVAILSTVFISDLFATRTRIVGCPTTAAAELTDSYGTNSQSTGIIHQSPKRHPNYDSCKVEMDENLRLYDNDINI